MTNNQALKLSKSDLIYNLPNMAIFAHIAASSSFAQAARDLNLSRSKVSKAVMALEASLGVRLFYRTTRSLALTDEGRVFKEKCTQMLAEAEAASQMVSSAQDAPHGTLTLSVPPNLGVIELDRMLPAFVKRYPDLAVDVEFSESFVDIVGEGRDLVLRVAHELSTSSLISRRLAASELYIVASSEYCCEYGRPETFQDLVHHKCIIYSATPTPNRWSMIAPDGSKRYVEISGPLTTNRSAVELQAALDGIGIARLPNFVCGPDLAAGRLVRLLEDVELPSLGIYAIYPQRQYLPAKVRIFVDFLVEYFKTFQHGSEI